MQRLPQTRMIVPEPLPTPFPLWTLTSTAQTACLSSTGATLIGPSGLAKVQTFWPFTI
jgi:hypothetical protein